MQEVALHGQQFIYVLLSYLNLQCSAVWCAVRLSLCHGGLVCIHSCVPPLARPWGNSSSLCCLCAIWLQPWSGGPICVAGLRLSYALRCSFPALAMLAPVSFVIQSRPSCGFPPLVLRHPLPHNSWSVGACSQVHGSWLGKNQYMCSGSLASSFLLTSRNLGQSRSQDAWPRALQFTHQNFLLSSSSQSAVLCSFPHVLQAFWWLHSAAKWLVFGDWHFKHLLGSLRSLLAHTLLPAITKPSRIAWFAASLVRKCAMRCATFCPGARLCSGLIHLVVSRSSASSLESHSILLFSARASGA